MEELDLVNTHEKGRYSNSGCELTCKQYTKLTKMIAEIREEKLLGAAAEVIFQTHCILEQFIQEYFTVNFNKHEFM